MATRQEFERLARAHQVKAVTEAAQLQAALSRLWTRLLDPTDLDGSFARWEAQAVRLVNASRTRGELTAQEYYLAAKQLADLGAPIAVPRQPSEEESTRKSLESSGLGHAKRRIKEGMTPEAALESARASVLRAAKRRALQAGRQRLVSLAHGDKDVSGWARVSDGSPCAFCAMLVSRGPVYSAATAPFQAHDGCGCSVRLALRNDPSKGWTPQARAFSDLWQDPGRREGQMGRYYLVGQTDLADFRTRYAEALAAGDLKTAA